MMSPELFFVTLATVRLSHSYSIYPNRIFDGVLWHTYTRLIWARIDA